MSGRREIGHYSAATKEEVVRLFLEERMTYPLLFLGVNLYNMDI